MTVTGETPLRILNSHSKIFPSHVNSKNKHHDKLHVELLNGEKRWYSMSDLKQKNKENVFNNIVDNLLKEYYNEKIKTSSE